MARMKAEQPATTYKGTLVHCVARCNQCGLTWEDYQTARDKAYRHARRTGHHVTVETGFWHEYNAPSKGNADA